MLDMRARRAVYICVVVPRRAGDSKGGSDSGIT